MEIIDYTKKNSLAEKKSENVLMDDIKHDLKEDKSVDVFNALNLYNENLGKLYEEQGYNPFDSDFTLDEEFAKDVLEIKSKKGKAFPEPFLDASNKNISKNFDIAIENNNEILKELQNKLKGNLSTQDKKQLKKMVITLKNRGELLKLAKDKLKQKDANALKMYLEIYGLDSELSELLEYSFTEKLNSIILSQKLFDLCKSRAILNNAYNLRQAEAKQVQEPIANKEVQNTNTNIKEQEIKQKQPKVREVPKIPTKPKVQEKSDNNNELNF